MKPYLTVLNHSTGFLLYCQPIFLCVHTYVQKCNTNVVQYENLTILLLFTVKSATVLVCSSAQTDAVCF